MDWKIKFPGVIALAAILALPTLNLIPVALEQVDSFEECRSDMWVGGPQDLNKYSSDEFPSCSEGERLGRAILKGVPG